MYKVTFDAKTKTITISLVESDYFGALIATDLTINEAHLIKAACQKLLPFINL